MFKTSITTKDGRKIVLREPRMSDAKGAMILINDLVRNGGAEGIGIDKTMTLAEEKKWLKGHLKNIRNRRTVFLIFEHNGRIIGSCGVNMEEGMSRHTAYFGIAVEKEYRRQGISMKAMSILFRLLKKRMKGINIIILNVHSYNTPAIKLYRKLGFRKVATLPDAVKRRGKLYPKHVMYYYLK